MAELPFDLPLLQFRAEVAGGYVEYDDYSHRVHSARERFVVRGTVGAELLGEAVGIGIEESQMIGVRLTDLNPWTK